MIVVPFVTLFIFCSCEETKTIELNKENDTIEEKDESEPKESKDYVIVKKLRIVVKVFKDGTVLSYSDAENKCNQLSLEGYDDWRLPTISELMSINANTTLLEDHNQWWSCTPYYYDSKTFHYFLDKGNAALSVDSNMWWVVAVRVY